ncbi:type II toxin-antitoxin system PemK/MazF family toxin [Bacillus subtilis subsp. subtilis]|uniref:type II toxin-antitoxin system PemK/MazF family toxin n=1 Tax=Bacillus subtilis TaxID=1423 RepID=UPI001AECECB7|nr:type II toxin-antitoxin system PemK/MazF family toxin [Bacillus subtilis]MBP3048943.1 type II toxin-antitoxin system PemK/MazF family toxin [Bacillus subtilis subsp. subtilis]
MSVERGDLVYLNFNPQAGHEQAGRRPAIVLSPKNFNQTTGFAVVCPITNQQKGYPFEVALPDGLAIQGVILTDQVKSLDWRARRFQVVSQAPEIIVSDCLDYIHTFL